MATARAEAAITAAKAFNAINTAHQAATAATAAALKAENAAAISQHELDKAASPMIWHSISKYRALQRKKRLAKMREQDRQKWIASESRHKQIYGELVVKTMRAMQARLESEKATMARHQREDLAKELRSVRLRIMRLRQTELRQSKLYRQSMRGRKQIQAKLEASRWRLLTILRDNANKALTGLKYWLKKGLLARQKKIEKRESQLFGLQKVAYAEEVKAAIAARKQHVLDTKEYFNDLLAEAKFRALVSPRFAARLTRRMKVAVRQAKRQGQKLLRKLSNDLKKTLKRLALVHRIQSREAQRKLKRARSRFMRQQRMNLKRFRQHLKRFRKTGRWSKFKAFIRSKARKARAALKKGLSSLKSKFGAKSKSSSRSSAKSSSSRKRLFLEVASKPRWLRRPTAAAASAGRQVARWDGSVRKAANRAARRAANAGRRATRSMSRAARRAYNRSRAAARRARALARRGAKKLRKIASAKLRAFLKKAKQLAKRMARTWKRAARALQAKAREYQRKRRELLRKTRQEMRKIRFQVQQQQARLRSYVLRQQMLLNEAKANLRKFKAQMAERRKRREDRNEKAVVDIREAESKNQDLVSKHAGVLTKYSQLISRMQTVRRAEDRRVAASARLRALLKGRAAQNALVQAAKRRLAAGKKLLLQQKALAASKEKDALAKQDRDREIAAQLQAKRIELQRAAEVYRVQHGGDLMRLRSNLTAFGRSYRRPIYSRFGPFCLLSGVAAGRNIRVTLSRLPASCRPNQRLIFDQHVDHTLTTRVDVFPNGLTQWHAGSGNIVAGWITFDGIIFPINSSVARPLNLSAPWVNFGGRYGQVGFVVEKGLCVLTGLVRIASWDVGNWVSLIGTLPNECRPKEGRLMFHVNNQDTTHRLDVLPDGQILWVLGSRRHAWLSLNGIAFFTSSSTHSLALENNWKPYSPSAGYRPPSVRREGQLCVLSGLAFAAQPSRYVAQLPAFCKPQARLIFHTSHHTGTLRIDIDIRGRVMWVDGVNSQNLVSFDGIFFTVGGSTEFSSIKQDPMKQLARRRIVLGGGLRPRRSGYEWPSVTQIGDLCIVNGVASGPNLKEGTAKVPPACRPANRLVFNTHVQGIEVGKEESYPSVRLDVKRVGEIGWAAGPVGTTKGWLTFNGLTYATRRAFGTSVLLKGSWERFPGFAPPQIVKQGDFCVVSGMVRLKHNDIKLFGETVGILPVGCRPKDGRLMFNVNHHDKTLRLDILPTGQINYMAGTRAYPWISLDGISFFTESASQPIPLSPRWTPYPARAAYRAPSYKRAGNLCALSGVMVGGPDKDLGTVPAECRPFGRLIFFTNHNQFVHRIDVYPDGRIRRAGGIVKFNFESLDGIRYTVAPLGFVSFVPKGDLPKQGPVALLNSARPLKRGYQDPMLKRVGDLCILGGSAEVFDMRAALVQLPRNCRPSKKRVFNVGLSKGKNARFDVLSNGMVRWAGGSADSWWVPLDGMMFSVQGVANVRVNLAPRWEDFGRKHQASGYIKQGDLCVVSGLIRVFDWNLNSWNPHLLTLPEECRPKDGQLIFHLNSNAFPHRVDVMPSGEVIWKSGTRVQPYISLDGIAFFTESSSQPLTLSNGFSAYSEGGTGFRRPSMKKQDSICLLSGVVNGNGRRTIASLSSECRPQGRITFTLNQEDKGVRVDIYPDGTVQWVGARRTQSWISLDGIRFAGAGPDVLAGTDTPKYLGRALVTSDSYKVYGEGFSAPQFSVIGSICIVYGMMKGNNLRETYTKLPKICQPESRTVFDNHVTESETMRLDVLPSGEIIYGGGSYDGNWVSLSGMAIPVKDRDSTPLKLNGGWVNFNDAWAHARITMQDELCVLSGVIARPDLAITSWNNNLLTVPQDCRPRNGRRVFMVNSDRNSHRVEMNEAGQLTWVAGSKAVPWISLNGISYFPASSDPIMLETGFQNFGNGYQTASSRKIGTLCVLSGMINGIGGRRHIATLSENCRPAGILVFAVNQHDSSLRFDVHPDGRILWEAGHNQYGWASLDGIHFIADSQPFGRVRTEPIDWQNGEIRLWNGINATGGAYVRPQYTRFGHLCMIEGSISRASDAENSFRTTFTRLPRDCRPERRLLLDIHNQLGETMRVDVNNDGIVRWTAGASVATSVSLAGSIFAAYGGPSEDLRLSLPWVNYERGYTQAQVTMQKDVCVVEGMIRIDDWDINRFSKVITQLPKECRPTGRVVFNVNHGESTDRIDVTTDGVVRWVAGAERVKPWLSLTGITFVRTQGQEVQLGKDWKMRGGDYRAPQWSKQGNVCFLSGVVEKKTDFNATIGFLPPACRPKADSAFTINHHDRVARFDVSREGVIQWITGVMHKAWFSLDGIRFVATEDQLVPAQRV